MKQQTKHMIFFFSINSWQTQRWDAPRYLGGIDLYSMKSKLGTPPSCAFFLLYPFNTDINVIIQNTPHHWNIIIWCPTSLHDAQWHHALFGRNVYTCAWYAEQTPSLRAWTLKWMLSSTPHGVENCDPRHIPWHSPPGISMYPCIKPARDKI